VMAQQLRFSTRRKLRKATLIRNFCDKKVEKFLSKNTYGDCILGFDPLGDARPENFYPEGNRSIQKSSRQDPKFPFGSDYNPDDLTTLEGFSYTAQTATFKTALNLGLHWGHSSKKTTSSMRPYIKGTVHGRDVIDLSLTIPMLRKVIRLMQSLVQDNCEILFVGNGRNQDINRLNQMMALKVGYPFLETSFVKHSLKSWDSHAVYYRSAGKPFDVVSESELTDDKQIARRHTQGNLFRRCRSIPDFVFFTTRKGNETFIKECNFCRVPVACLADTDDKVSDVQYLIPCNTESPQSVHFVLDMLTRGILEAQEAKEQEWWAKKQDEKEYNQQLKDAQDIYNSDLFLDQRTRNLRRRDMGYDSDGWAEDGEEDFFDKEFIQRDTDGQSLQKAGAVETLARKAPPRGSQQDRGKSDREGGPSSDPKVNEMEYLKRVNAFNEHSKALEKKKQSKPQTTLKPSLANPTFSFTDLVVNAQQALLKNPELEEKRRKIEQENSVTKDVY